MAQLIGRHAGPGLIERALFHPWLEGAHATPAPERPAEQIDPWLFLAPRTAGA
ncbi:hypothetical protein D3C83_98360 [compost metagenome]